MGLVLTLRRFERVTVGDNVFECTFVRPHNPSQRGRFDLHDLTRNTVHQFELDGPQKEILPRVRVQARESQQSGAARFVFDAPRDIPIGTVPSPGAGERRHTMQQERARARG